MQSAESRREKKDKNDQKSFSLSVVYQSSATKEQEYAIPHSVGANHSPPPENTPAKAYYSG